MSAHLSTFADFVNLFITYRLKQSISELLFIATEMVSTIVFFFSFREITLKEQKSR